MTKPAGSACAQCPGRDSPCVFPEPAAGRTHLVVVGDAPTHGDVREGQLFSGGAGRLLDRKLKWRRDEIHWTNAVLCDVPDEELSKARKCCAARLLDEIKDTGCKTVMAAGPLATQSAAGLSRKPAIQSYRGTVLTPDDPLRTDGGAHYVLPVLPMGFAMRAEHWAPIVEADLARVVRVAYKGYEHPEDIYDMVVATDLKVLQTLLPKLGKNVVVDIETTGLDVHTVSMTCLVLSDEVMSVVIPWSKTQAGDGLFFNGKHQQVVDLINSTLTTRTAVTHNGPAYDHIGLRRFGIKIADWDDSLLGYHVVTSHFPKRLGHVVSCYLDAPPWKEWPHDVSLAELWSYCGRDGLYTARAWAALSDTMDASDWRVYDSDKRSAELCTDMSINGFAFDREHAAVVSTALRTRARELEHEAAEIVGVRELNLLSPRQLGDAFFNVLGARVCFRTDSGAASLGKDAMTAYAAMADERISALALKVIEYRSVRKCCATYVDGIKPHADGRVRPTWKSYGTVSGRWAAQKPNLANLPRAENDASQAFGGVRSLYIAAPGHTLVAFDVSQMEFRVAAYLSGDPNMIASCAPGQDIHMANAQRIFGAAFDAADASTRKVLRSLAKTSGFAVCYLAEAVTVHARLVSSGQAVTLAQVEAMLRSLRQAFAVYYDFQAENLLTTIRRGYVESPILGRKRWLGHSPSPPENANFPIQSGAADIMNTKLGQIDDRRKMELPAAKLVAMVYDAAYFEVPHGQEEHMIAICQDVFSEPVSISNRDFVLPIDVHTGQRWSDL